MAITKLGETFIRKQAAPTGILTAILNKIAPKNGFSTLFSLGEKAVKIPGKAYSIAKPIATPLIKGTVKGTSAVGKSMARHPGYTLPLIGMGAYGAANFKSNFKKNWLHTDPKQNLTYRASLDSTVRPGAIKFRDPRLEKFYRNSKSDHILY